MKLADVAVTTLISLVVLAPLFFISLRGQIAWGASCTTVVTVWALVDGIRRVDDPRVTVRLNRGRAR